MLICSHIVLPRYFYIFLHLRQNEDMCYRFMLLVAPPSPHKKIVFLSTHFLDEVLKQLYLEKMNKSFKMKEICF